MNTGEHFQYNLKKPTFAIQHTGTAKCMYSIAFSYMTSFIIMVTVISLSEKDVNAYRMFKIFFLYERLFFLHTCIVLSMYIVIKVFHI